MTNTEAIQEIEKNIAQAKEIVELGNAMERLSQNRDFKKIVKEGYFRDEAIRLVHLKADPNMQTPEKQQAVLLQMDAIGAVNQYFQTIFHRAAVASKAIAADEEVRDEILAEEAEHG